MEPPPPPWSEIPLELAGLVLGRLPAHADRIRFATTCRQWRAAACEFPPPPPLPLLALPDGTIYSPPLPNPFRLPDAAGYSAACGNWLLFSDADGGCFLRNPMSNATVPLPALHRVRHMYKKSDGSFGHDDDNIFGYASLNPAVRRLLLCSPHLVVAYAVLDAQGLYVPCNCDGTGLLRITVCRPGAGSWWSVSMDDLMIPILAGMAFHKGTLFAIERCRGRLYAIDISEDESTGDPCVSEFRLVIDSVPSFPSLSTILHEHGRGIMEPLFTLVESRGTLLMVRRRMHSQWTQLHKLVATGWNEFEVFEADLHGSCWTKVATIGDDQVLFLSGDHCRSLSVFRSLGRCPGIALSSLRMIMRITAGMRRKARALAVSMIWETARYPLFSQRTCTGSVARCVRQGSSRRTQVKLLLYEL
ncbi:unnamed protein product [Urochloa humidicola]